MDTKLLTTSIGGHFNPRQRSRPRSVCWGGEEGNGVDIFVTAFDKGALGGVGGHPELGGREGEGWTYFGPDSASGQTRRGWRSSKDLSEEGDTDWYPIGSLSERFGII